MRVLGLASIRAVMIIAIFSLPSCYGGMGHGGMMGGGMGFGMVLVTLFWVALIVGVIFLIVWLIRRGRSDRDGIQAVPKRYDVSGGLMMAFSRVYSIF